MPDDFEQMWAALAPLGRSAASGGYFRQPFTPAEVRAARVVRRAVPGARARGGGRRQRQPAGLVDGPGGTRRRGRRWSARTSTRSSTAGRTTARSAWSRRWRRSTCCASGACTPRRPVAVGAFAEEEGSRFGLACLGFAAGDRRDDARTRPRELRDRDGVPLLDAMDAAGLEPGARQSRLGGPDRLLPGAARRAGPRPRRPRRGGRAGQRRSGRTAATASTSPASRQPRRHHADGGPARPDAELRDDCPGGRQAGDAGRAAGHLRPCRGRPQRHQRDPVAGHGVAGRPLRRARPSWSGWSPRSSGRAPSGPAATAPGSA